MSGMSEAVVSGFSKKIREFYFGQYNAVILKRDGDTHLFDGFDKQSLPEIGYAYFPIDYEEFGCDGQGGAPVEDPSCLYISLVPNWDAPDSEHILLALSLKSVVDYSISGASNYYGRVVLPSHSLQKLRRMLRDLSRVVDDAIEEAEQDLSETAQTLRMTKHHER